MIKIFTQSSFEEPVKYTKCQYKFIVLCRKKFILNFYNLISNNLDLMIEALRVWNFLPEVP